MVNLAPATDNGIPSPGGWDSPLTEPTCSQGASRTEREQALREAEQRHRWYATVAQAREQQVEQHRVKALAEQVKTWQLTSALQTPPDPPASREAPREGLKG